MANIGRVGLSNVGRFNAPQRITADAPSNDVPLAFGVPRIVVLPADPLPQVSPKYISPGNSYDAIISEPASAADAVSLLQVDNGFGVRIPHIVVLADDPLPQTTRKFISPGTIYSAAIEEPASATDAVGGLAVFPRTVSEPLTAADATDALAVFPRSVAETAAAVDAVDATPTWLVTVAEAAAATDTVASLGVLTAAITETASAADTSSAAADGIKIEYGGRVPKIVSLADDPLPQVSPKFVSAAVTSYDVTISEAASATDAVSLIQVDNGFGVRIPHIVVVPDDPLPQVTAKFVPAVAVAADLPPPSRRVPIWTWGTLTAFPGAAPEFVPPEPENVGAGDQPTSGYIPKIVVVPDGPLPQVTRKFVAEAPGNVYGAIIAEAASATDTVTAAAVAVGALAEAASAADTITAAAIAVGAIAEAASATETVSAAAVAVGAIEEAASATETIAAAAAVTTVEEAASAVDTVAAAMVATAAIAEAASATDTLDATGGTVVVQPPTEQPGGGYTGRVSGASRGRMIRRRKRGELDLPPDLEPPPLEPSPPDLPPPAPGPKPPDLLPPPPGLMADMTMPQPKPLPPHVDEDEDEIALLLEILNRS